MTNKTKKIAVVAGGLSSERTISLLSGASILTALKAKGYDAFLIDLKDDIFAFVKELKKTKPDVIFNALHGRWGEDGNIQGLFNLMKIPYTHSGLLASAIGMNKKASKMFFAQSGIPVAPDKVVTFADIKNGDTLPFPYVIKPINEGSSVGVHIIEDAAAEKVLLEQWPFAGQAVLMETYIKGRELSVGVLDGKVLGIVEIVPKTGFYDYTNKYTSGCTDHILSPELPKQQKELLEKYAVLAHQSIRAKGVSRTDFRYDDSNPEKPIIVALEINTQPGMTQLSLVPEMAKIAGISYEDLVSYLVEEAKCGS